MPQTGSDAQARSLTEAIEALRAGELVVYPTETFYGLGADPLSPAALERLFALKRREPDKPVALIAADSASAFKLARTIPDIAHRLAVAFWPGPLTLVLPARDGFPPALLGSDGGIGVRVSPHPAARALAAGLGRPITATSANLAGEPPTTIIAETRMAFGVKVKTYLDGGTLTGGAPSTIVAFDSAGVRVLRAGAINEQAIATALAVGGRR
jgi:L-threonylcarbamoyladenylate synthase